MPNLDDTYTQTVNEQRNYLLSLQTAFNQHCEEITAQAQEKLNKTPETDIEGRKKIADEQKKLLEDAIVQLKKEINGSSSKNRVRLEEIFSQIENAKLADLEKAIKTL